MTRYHGTGKPVPICFLLVSASEYDGPGIWISRTVGETAE